MRNFTPLVRMALKHLSLPTVQCAKHFTFVLYKGKLFTWGWNQRLQVDDLNKQHSKHAEIHALHRLNAALRNAHGRQRQFELVNVRVNALGQIGNAMPCSQCHAQIAAYHSPWAMIKRVWHSVEEGTFRAIKVTS